MPETPDDILRSLADPERLAIAGRLAGGDATARDLSQTLGLPIARVRKHLNRLSAAGVARAAEFTWERAGARLLEIYRQAAQMSQT